VIVEVIVVVIVGLYFCFKAAGWGKERVLYPPSSWCQITQAFGASFRLDPKNQGVVASF
jgi:hypothetical protein